MPHSLNVPSQAVLQDSLLVLFWRSGDQPVVTQDHLLEARVPRNRSCQWDILKPGGSLCWYLFSLCSWRYDCKRHCKIFTGHSWLRSLWYTDFSAKQMLSILVKTSKKKQQTNKTLQKCQTPCPPAINDPMKPPQHYQFFPYSLYQYCQITYSQ